MWTLLSGLARHVWSRFAYGLTMAAAVALGLLWLFMKGRASGRAAYIAKRERARTKAIRTRRKIADDIRKSSDADLDRELGRWMRD